VNIKQTESKEIHSKTYRKNSETEDQGKNLETSKRKMMPYLQKSNNLNYSRVLIRNQRSDGSSATFFQVLKENNFQTRNKRVNRDIPCQQT
jgi:CRISPR/Cas system CSM-associated protein Csm2 small subunit